MNSFSFSLPSFPFSPCLRTGVMWACFQHLGTRPYSPLWRNLNLAGYSRCFSMSWLIPQDCWRFSMSWLKPSDCWCFGIFIAEHLQPVSLYPPCLSGVSGRPSCFQRCGLNQSPSAQTVWTSNDSAGNHWVSEKIRHPSVKTILASDNNSRLLRIDGSFPDLGGYLWNHITENFEDRVVDTGSACWDEKYWILKLETTRPLVVCAYIYME